VWDNKLYFNTHLRTRDEGHSDANFCHHDIQHKELDRPVRSILLGLDLPQVDLINFRVENVRSRSGVEDVRPRSGRF